MLIYISLQMTNVHIDLRRIIVEDWLTIPGEDKLKQRAIDILGQWEQLLLSNDLDDYCWARVASPSPPRYCVHSLVYVPKDKRHGEPIVFSSLRGNPYISLFYFKKYCSIAKGFRLRCAEHCIRFET
jgi:hypothetical protein